MATFGTMGTTLSHLDDRVRDYPDDRYGLADDAEYDDYGPDEGPHDGHEDYNWTGWPADSRWRPATAILGAVVALGAIATAVIINSGDSVSTKATVGAPAPRPVTSAPTPSKTTVPPSAQPGPSHVPQLPPETFTTVTTTPSAAPAQTPTAAPPPAAAPGQPPSVALNPRTVVYSVTGSKQLLDLVNVVYTDARGYPQTEFNVSLPWSKVVVLNPGVQTESVVATSFYGRLNCAIVNAAGQPVVASANSTNLATCAR